MRINRRENAEFSLPSTDNKSISPFIYSFFSVSKNPGYFCARREPVRDARDKQDSQGKTKISLRGSSAAAFLPPFLVGEREAEEKREKRELPQHLSGSRIIIYIR